MLVQPMKFLGPSISHVEFYTCLKCSGWLRDKGQRTNMQPTSLWLEACKQQKIANNNEMPSEKLHIILTNGKDNRKKKMLFHKIF